MGAIYGERQRADAHDEFAVFKDAYDVAFKPFEFALDDADELVPRLIIGKGFREEAQAVARHVGHLS